MIKFLDLKVINDSFEPEHYQMQLNAYLIQDGIHLEKKMKRLKRSTPSLLDRNNVLEWLMVWTR